jgi:conjugative relaxase-like TrwC/TraI family protein
LQVPQSGTCGTSRGTRSVKFTVTKLGGSGRDLARIVDAILRYLQPKDPPASALAAVVPSSTNHTRDGATEYYADAGEETGRWLGRGAAAMGLSGDVDREDFGQVLAGRHPRTGERLITAQGSAGRRPDLGVGNETRHDDHGHALYDARDAAAVLGLSIEHAQRMFDIGTLVALSRVVPLPAEVHNQPGGSYLVPRIDPDGNRWVTDAELSRWLDARVTDDPAEAVAASGEPGDEMTLAEAARFAGVTPRYLRRLAKAYQDDKDHIDAVVAAGRQPRRDYLPARKDERGRWLVVRRDLAAYLDRREPPAVRVALDLTLTTEKSLGLLAFLSDDATRDVVLDAIAAGNDWALDWLERHAAFARHDDKPIPVRGWTVASFRHFTSRALDPFPHHHNVIANTAEDHQGVRRALDARYLHHEAKAASALATAEMRYQLTDRLGVRWRPSRHGGWEIAGFSDPVLREFSQRRIEIETALREYEEALGHAAHPDAVAHISLATRPAKLRAHVDELLAGWWRRAEALGFTPADLAACTGREPPPEPPIPAELFEMLADPDSGICQNLSVFKRGDVLAALVNLAVPPPSTDEDDEANADDIDHDDLADDGEPGGTGEGEPQPLIVGAAELERLADAFLESRHVEQIAPATPERPALYSTREMLAVQDRIIARYRQGRHLGHGVVPGPIVERVVVDQTHLTFEQRQLVREFCTSGHAIACAIGRAGTGKTRTMAAAAAAWEASGWRVVGAAVKGEAARTLAAATGIPTETLAWYLAHDDPLTVPLDARTVLVVDEASTISDRDLDQLSWLAQQTGATLRLIGDPAQHGAVEAGGMFRVLCQRHPDHTPELTETHRLRDPHDRLAADALREGQVAKALDHLEAAGHLHIVDDEFQIYVELLTRWWDGHQHGQHHPMVTRDNHTRRQLNRLAHTLLRAHGEIGNEEVLAANDRRFAVGDRVIARAPNRDLHTGQRSQYVRNGATGTIAGLHRGGDPDDHYLTIDFDQIGTIDIPRTFFDEHEVAPGQRDVGIDHAYAVTSYAVQGATHPMSTSRIDETSTRAETYVDITRGTDANHVYLTRPDDPLDGEHLPRVPPDPIDQAITDRLERSEGEKTAWEIRQNTRDRAADRRGPDLGW